MFSLNSYLEPIRALLPSRCLLCRSNSHRSLPLCRPCQLELPWLGNHCQRCALPIPKPGNSSNQLCGECLRNPPPWQHCIAAFEYRPPLKQLINRYKEHSDLASGRILATLLSKSIELNAPQPLPQLLLPVPLHWRRQFSRGFNQSYDLARMLSTRLGIPCSHNHLRKTHHTRPQHNLPRAERQRNLRNQFEVTKSVEGLHIALVDDVITTSSTARILAKTLLKAGAAQVDIWCIARTPAPNNR